MTESMKRVILQMSFCLMAGMLVMSCTTKTSRVQVFTVGGVQFTMIPVQGGTFTMGATEEQDAGVDDSEKPVHKVTLSDYYIGETEVTQALWEAVMGSNPSHFRGVNNPVEQVSWNDCHKFIAKLNAMTGQQFRLPTEAEWEFAARGGNKGKVTKFAGSDDIDSVAWYNESLKKGSTHEVKVKQPNELGVYDMTGNVWEWCSDRFGVYLEEPQTDPRGSSDGIFRLIRGGGWVSPVERCRVSSRMPDGIPTLRIHFVGLRLAL